MTNRLEEMMKKYNKSVKQVADSSGLGSDYIYRIKNPKYKERLNEDNIKQFADAIGCYPSELLPVEWQKPADNNIDTDIMTEALRRTVKDLQKLKKPLDLETIAELSPAHYLEVLDERKELKGKIIRIDNKS